MNATPPAIYDLAVIGGGINGAGIARDAAGRGLSVLLAEKDDLASHTSSWSTKLVHGGLRYLEHYEFRLVAESLSEREVLLRLAPHIIEPLQFVLPHEPHLRPAWMIRAGLFLYDPSAAGRRCRRRSASTSTRANGAQDSKTASGKASSTRTRESMMRDWSSSMIAARELGADVRVRTRLATARRGRPVARIGRRRRTA
jgi:glycerol-3-phosphate dehydrogenase